MEMNCAYTGIENRMVKFVEQRQLKDKALWKLFSDQFIGCADTHDCGWRGEYWGKLMRGACMTYQYSHDEELYEILNETVCDMLQYADEDGRYSTYHVSAEFGGWDMWARKYVLLGFLHFHEICKDDKLKDEIVSAMKAHLNYIIAHIGEGKTHICDTSPVWQGVNSASILEPVVMLYKLTGEESYLDFASHIVNSGAAKDFDIFEAAYENILKPYEYSVKKAYEVMSCFEGLIEYYDVTKEEKWKIAADNFAKQLIENEVTIIGCAGCEHECFNHSALMQTYTKYDGLMQETCVTVTWMKLCNRLLKLTGNSIYADEIEKSAYNALYGAVNTEKCVNGPDTMFDLKYFREVHRVHTKKYGAQPFDSYSPLRVGTRGRAIGGYRPMRDNSVYSGCCIAIGAAGVALAVNMAVVADEDEVKFNLYHNGSCECDGFKAEIKGGYPSDGNIAITIDCDIEKTLRLRIPYFSEKTTITLNSGAVAYEMNNGYAQINRKWSKGDVIELKLDMHPRMLNGMKNIEDCDSERHVAFMYGPLVLARDERVSEVGATVKIGDTLECTEPRQTELMQCA